MACFIVMKQQKQHCLLYRRLIMNRGSDLNRTKRAESLRKVVAQSLQAPPLLSPRGRAKEMGEITLKAVVQQVVKYLIEIVQALLQQENSQNYRSFLAETQAMHRELQQKMMHAVAERCGEVRLEFMEKVQQVEKQAKHAHPPLPASRNALQQERKKITQNILSRASSFNCFPQNRSQDLEKFGSERELPSVQEGEGKEQRTSQVGSIGLNSIQSKLSALQEVQNGRMRQAIQKLQRKFEENCRDIKLLSQKHLEFRLNFEQKLELSLQSLWNVTSDNQSKLCQIERHLKLS